MQRNGSAATPRPIAYFSAEFALHQSLPIYAGGLGVLAGDHCKEASDLGVPFVAVGFMYPQGYFHQSVTSEGWQEERYRRINWEDAPIEPALTAGRQALRDRRAARRSARCWSRSGTSTSGHTQLYLLDTDLEENAPWDRELTARLYGGDRETRVQQEIILGIGGVRALRALGYDPAVWHLNEGHAGFVVLQRIHEFLDKGLSLRRTRSPTCARSTVFTTHTPVPAGHDAFPFSLVETHLAGCWGRLGEHREDFLALGRHDNGFGTHVQHDGAGAALVELRQRRQPPARRGDARRCGRRSGPAAEPAQVPVTSITNGVHLDDLARRPTWAGSSIATSTRTGASATTSRRSGSASSPSPTKSCGRSATRCAAILVTFVRERVRERWMQRAGQRRRASSPAARCSRPTC